MRVLIDINHPAHVHFFRNPIQLLQEQGHTVLVSSRDKDCAVALLDGLGIEHKCLTRQNQGGVLGMVGELAARDRALASLARHFRPDVITGLGGIFSAHVGWWLNIPSVVFYDTENALLQNSLTYPLATRVVVPRCYRGWTPKRKTTRYRGYHELAYLHPNYFSPSRDIALASGLSPDGDTFLLRLVSWKASHDLGKRGWSRSLLESVVQRLEKQGKVIISSEGALPSALEHMRYSGPAQNIHHLLAYCRAYAGESPTMASEAAILGVPAVYVASASLGYVEEQERRYGMVKFAKSDSVRDALNALDHVTSIPACEFRRRRKTMLDESIDIPGFVTDILLDFDKSRIN